MREKAKKPSIRFKGYTDDWEQHKYSDIATTRRGLTYKPDNIVDGGKRVLRSSNINEDTFEIHNDDVFVDEEAVNIPCVKNGDILITSANGSSRLVGKHAIIRGIPDNAAVHGGFMLLASSDEPEFVNALMSSQWYTRFINVYVAGGNGAIGNLNKNDLDEQIVLVPSKSEREKIGTLFANLDNLITLHQCKHDKLKNIKEAMLAKMLPRNGAVVPEIRFKGFTEPWKQRKLEELVSFSKGSGYSKGDLREDGMPIILYGRLYTKYETVISEVDTFVEEKKGSVHSKGGEVIVPASGETAEDIAIASVVEKPGVLLGGDLNVIKPPDELDSAFLAISISNGKPHNDMAKMAQGKSVVHLHNSDLAKIELLYPCKEEQQRISGFFSDSDSLIALHQCKLDKLKNLKESMKAQMFPK